jgi:hypothetical protein
VSIVRRWLVRVLVLVAITGPVVCVFAVPADAALSAGCTQTAGTGNVSCSFTTSGEHPVVVPAGVTTVHVTVVGGQGGSAAAGPLGGGMGASVVANIAVTGGSTLYGEVNIGGGAGGSGPAFSTGGGASDLRTCSTSSACGALGTVADPRLLVAGGGGGEGGFTGTGGGNGGIGGAGGSASCNAGGNGDDATGGAFDGDGGAGGSCVGGGAGGVGAFAPNGGAGAAGQGGDGEPIGENGGSGGGGGGYFGGGAGGGNATPGNTGGGGGGSSFAAATATNVVMSTATSGTASLTIAFVRPPDHLVVTPATASVTDGASQTFAVTAFDSDGNSLGDVTSASTLTIAGGGTCTGASCAASGVGAHLVTAADGSASGTAALTATAAIVVAAATLPATGTNTEPLLMVGLGLLATGLTAMSLARLRTRPQR